MIFSRRFDERAADLLGDLADLHLLGEERIKPACPLFDWYVKPHLDSPSFRNRDEAWADRLAASVDFPLYLLDDDSAIRGGGDKGGRRLDRALAAGRAMTAPSLPRESRRTPAVADGRMAA